MQLEQQKWEALHNVMDTMTHIVLNIINPTELIVTRKFYFIYL